MRSILTLALLALSGSLFAQQVKFREDMFENGMKYPILEFPSKESSQLAINKQIEAAIEAYKQHSFCIGTYGYVQKTNFLQMHIYANCLELPASENTYLLFDLETGNQVQPSFMIDPMQKEKFHVFLREKTESYLTSKSIQPADANAVSTLTLDNFNVILETNGFQMSCHSIPEWGDDIMMMSWKELQDYLKISYM